MTPIKLEQLEQRRDELIDENITLRNLIDVRGNAQLQKKLEQNQAELFTILPVIEAAKLMGRQKTVGETPLWKYVPQSKDKPLYVCGAPNIVQGGFCTKGVRHQGMKCWLHKED